MPKCLEDSDQPWVENMRDLWAEKALDQDKVLERRLVYYDQHGEIFGLGTSTPNWWTLEPDDTLECWKEVLQEGIELDDESLQSLVELVQNHERLGFQEGCRIIAHLLKDTDVNGGSWRTSPSAWLQKAVEETRLAFRRYAGGQREERASMGCGKGSGPCGPSAAASGSSAWANWKGTSSSWGPPAAMPTAPPMDTMQWNPSRSTAVPPPPPLGPPHRATPWSGDDPWSNWTSGGASSSSGGPPRQQRGFR